MTVSKNSSILNSLSLINPLADLFNMDEDMSNPYSFNHTRIYKDNRAFVLCNQKDWFLDDYMQTKKSTILAYDYFEESKRQFIWSRNPTFLKDRANLIAMANKHINIDASVMVQVKTAEYSDRFVFADRVRQHHFIDKFINHPDFMDRMIQKYYERTAALLIKAEEKCFFVTDAITRPKQNIDNIFPTEAMNIFLSQILDHSIALTEREYQLLTLSIYGYKPQEIGEKFYLSPRTVENKLQSIRSRLGCSSISEIFNLLHRSGAFKLYMDEACKTMCEHFNLI